MKRRLNYICGLCSAHDGAGTSITNLWSASPSELSFITNGFGYDIAWFRSQDPYNYGTTSPYARSVTSSGGFGRTNVTADRPLRPAVHITLP